MADLVELTRTERIALIDFLETLGDEEWQTPSLCDGWTVQDVAAHLAWAPVMSPLRMGVEVVRARLSVNRMIADTARRDASKGTAAILDQLRANAESGTKPMGMPQVAALGDAVVHHSDIRRPLGKPRAVPQEALEPAAAFFASLAGPATMVVGDKGRKAIDGFRLVADDVDWARGEGLEVHGSAETLLLLLAGRQVEREDLTGPGAEELFGLLAG